MNIILNCHNISKSFNRKKVFTGLNVNLKNGEIVGLFGPNGSGKSTVIKILACLLAPDNGKIELSIDNKQVARSDFNKYISLVAPYMNLYDEFTPVELYRIAMKIQGYPIDYNDFSQWLDYYGLKSYENYPINQFSTGMQYKLMLILALMNDKPIKLLDEPFSNLDEQAREQTIDKIKELQAGGYAFVIASNYPGDRKLCDSIVELNDLKKGGK